MNLSSVRNGPETFNPYGPDFKFRLYDSVEERNNLFGNNFMLDTTRERSYMNGHFSQCDKTPEDIRFGPKQYYYDMRVDDAQKTIMGPMNVRPNLYDDIVVPYLPTFEKTNSYKSWEPFTTTATAVKRGHATEWIPHTPVEVAPNRDARLWQADQNSLLYERKLISSARENPYANHYRRQGLVSLMALNMRPNNDFYTKKINSLDDTFGETMKKNNNIPPATTSF